MFFCRLKWFCYAVSRSLFRSRTNQINFDWFAKRFSVCAYGTDHLKFSRIFVCVLRKNKFKLMNFLRLTLAELKQLDIYFKGSILENKTNLLLSL